MAVKRKKGKRKKKKQIAKRGKPSIYLDTNIIRDCTHNRNDNSKKLINHAEENKWGCTTSIFGLMELTDIEQESVFLHKKYFMKKWELDKIISLRKQKDLKKEDFKEILTYIEEFIEKYGFIKIRDIGSEGWSLALYMAIDSNLHATDVIHLVTAWQSDCDVIVTNDGFFIKEATRLLKKEKVWSKLKICRPEKAIETLKRMGYKNV